ncbi:hypothetical protein GCM10022234_26430 [Aeromicrobium panaciterrae]|uniref:hypothetical protein n=1 Tax=Aeromicrobium panaciterrae TaxID=363861 RepID=UPI0031CE270A
MTWNAYNRRKEVLREILAIADKRRELSITELLDTVDGGREAYANETELLFDIQMNWFQRLSGQLDRQLSEGVDTPEIMAVSAWVNAASDMPGARALLDAQIDNPALGKAFVKEHTLLAASAGVPWNHPDLSGHGKRLQDSARESVVYAEPVEAESAPSGSLLSKLRSRAA